MYGWLRPRVAIPMHGEARHLREHARLAKAAGVPEVHTLTDGQMVRIAPGPSAVIDEAPVGRLFRDGRLILPGDDGPVQERRKLSVVGLVAVAIALNRRGDVVGEPDVELDGIPTETASGESMEDLVLDAVDGTLASIPQPKRRDPALVRDALKRAVRAAVEQAWGKKPITKVLITRVEAKG